MTAAEAPLLTVSGLCAGYGSATVVHDVELAVRDGETVVLIGPNGHGKTTVLRAVTGLVPPRAGEVVFAGERIDGMSAEAITERGVIHVPQGDHLFGALTVEENLLMGAFPRAAWRERAKALERIFALFPVLRERRAQRTRTLSGGERRQVALGRGLMRRPRLLIIDEPSLGLAPVIVQAVYEAIGQIADEGSTALLLVEENFRHIEQLADHVCLLEMGRVVRSGAPAELADDPAVAGAYLGAIA